MQAICAITSIVPWRDADMYEQYGIIRDYQGDLLVHKLHSWPSAFNKLLMVPFLLVDCTQGEGFLFEKRASASLLAKKELDCLFTYISQFPVTHCFLSGFHVGRACRYSV